MMLLLGWKELTEIDDVAIENRLSDVVREMGRKNRNLTVDDVLL